MADSEASGDLVVKLRKLKYKRRGRKSCVTKRIDLLREMMAKMEKKKRISFVLNSLHTMFDQLDEVCSEIAGLMEEADEYNDIEEIRLRVEMFTETVADHLQNRLDEGETPSVSSLTSSWVRKHALNGSAVGSGSDEVSQVSGDICESVTLSQVHEGDSVDMLAESLRHLPVQAESRTNALEAEVDPDRDPGSHSGSSGILDSTIIPNVSSSPIFSGESESVSAPLVVRKRDSVVTATAEDSPVDTQHLLPILERGGMFVRPPPELSREGSPIPTTSNISHSVYGSNDPFLSSTMLPGERSVVWTPPPKNFGPGWRSGREMVNDDDSDADIKYTGVMTSLGNAGGFFSGSGTHIPDPPGNAVTNLNYSLFPADARNFPLGSYGVPGDSSGIPFQFDGSKIQGSRLSAFGLPVDPGDSVRDRAIGPLHSGVHPHGSGGNSAISGRGHATGGQTTDNHPTGADLSKSFNGGGVSNILTSSFPFSGSKSSGVVNPIAGGTSAGMNNHVVSSAPQLQPVIRGQARASSKDFKDQMNRTDGRSHVVGLKGPDVRAGGRMSYAAGHDGQASNTTSAAFSATPPLRQMLLVPKEPQALELLLP